MKMSVLIPVGTRIIRAQSFKKVLRSVKFENIFRRIYFFPSKSIRHGLRHTHSLKKKAIFLHQRTPQN